MIEGVQIKNLEIIPGNNGQIFHAFHTIKDPDINLKEVYFSTIEQNYFRAWKLHTKMTVNLLVIHGSVKVVMIDKREFSSTFNNCQEIILSQDPFCRLQIPPKVWFGFQGLSSSENILCNFADLHHDKNEIKNCKYDEFDYEFKEKKIK